MRRLLFVLLVAVACHSPTEPLVVDPPHHWELRFDARPGSRYFYCTTGSHEPRTEQETADAYAWFILTYGVTLPVAP